MKSEYLILLAICFAGPFILGFSRKIGFYSNPKRLLISLILPFVVFIAWDSFAIYRGHWYYNRSYVSGVTIANLPIEEILFFIIIPFCALFSWECVKYYSKKNK